MTMDPRASARGRLVACAVALALALTACASAPVTRFHTLVPAEAAPPAAASASAVSWELLPVDIPVQVSRPQLVVRLADDTLAVLEHDRWIAPLDVDLRVALGEQLATRLGPPAAAGANAAGTGAAHWRIDVQVLRFDSEANQHARLTADWAIRGRTASLSCRTTIEEAATGASVTAIVRAHQRVVGRLADAMAVALGGMVRGDVVTCPSAK